MIFLWIMILFLSLLFSAFLLFLNYENNKKIIFMYVCAVNHVFLIVKLQRNFGPNMAIFPVVAS